MAVETKHKEYEKRAPDWKLVRDFIEGESAVHAAGEVYLPKMAKQKTASYESFKKRAVLFNATERTHAALSGLVFRKPPKVELPPDLEALAENIDLRGSNLTGFSEMVVDELLATGRAGILVGHQRQEIEGSRPFLRLYSAEEAWNWRYGMDSGEMMLAEARLHEKLMRPVEGKEFEVEEVEQIRVLDVDEGRYRQRTYEKTAEVTWDLVPGSEIFPTASGEALDEVPMVFISPKDTSGTVEKSPILDLARLNRGHYQMTALKKNALHFAGNPTPVFFGWAEDGPIGLGSETAIVIPNENASAMFLSLGSEGIDALERDLQQTQAQMATQGARILAVDKRAAEAAETETIRRAPENSILASLAGAASAGITKALQTLADWARITGDVSFELNRDYLAIPMSAQGLQAHVAAWQAGAITDEELFVQLKTGEIIGEEQSFEDHQAELELTREPDSDGDGT